MAKLDSTIIYGDLKVVNTIMVNGSITTPVFYGALSGHASLDLALSGGTVSGETIYTGNIKARKSQSTSYVDAALWTESYSATATGIAFHILGNVGKFLGMYTDGNLYWHGNKVIDDSDGRLTNARAANGGDADTVDGQHFNWSNQDNNPSYVWGTHSNGTNWLAATAQLSVKYAANSSKTNQLQAYTADNFTGGEHYVKAIRYDGWNTRLKMCYDGGATTADSVSVNYASSSGSISGYNNPTSNVDANTIAYRDSGAGLNASMYNSYADDNGYVARSFNTSAGSPMQFYISHSGGNVNIGNSRGSLTLLGNATTANNSDTCDGLHVHSDRNNEANKIVRTESNGYLYTGYINCSNGNENNNSNADRVWGTNGSDDFMRSYRTSALSVAYAAKAARANGNFYIDDNYGCSIVGLYNSGVYQGIYAMGDGYKLPVGGATPGSLYGLAWTHTNVGGQSKAGLSHQMLVMENGVTKTAIGTGIWTAGTITASGTITGTDFQLSDKILKENIVPIDNLSRFDNITFSQFTMKSDIKKTQRYGVIAQEIEAISPEFVCANDEGLKAVNYIELLIAKVARLEERIKQLEDGKDTTIRI